jgi:putative phage-type endonuclease
MTEFDIDRRSGIGASEAPAVLGVDPYRSAADVWALKTGLATEQEENLAMRLGNLLEPVVAQLFAERTGIRVRRHRRAVYDPQHRFLWAHLDRWTPDEVIEIKTTSRPSDEWGADGSSDVPVTVMVQTLLQMRYARRQRARVAALLWGRELRVYELAYDAELADEIVMRLAAFWTDHVLANVQPPVDGSDASRAFLARRYPRDSGEEIVAAPENLPLVMRLLSARADTERAKAEQQEAENNVKQFMAEATTLRWETGTVTWRAQTRRSTDWQRVAEWAGSQLLAQGQINDESWAELVAGNTTASESRVFRVNERKE